MSNTEENRSSRTKSKNKYNAKTYDQFLVTVPKGCKDEIDLLAKQLGYKSRNALVVSALEEKTGTKFR